MPVAVRDVLLRGAPARAGNLLGRRPSRDPQGDRRMPKIVDAQAIELGGTDRRPPDAPADVGGPQGGSLRPGEDQTVRVGLCVGGQMTLEFLGDRSWKTDRPSGRASGRGRVW